MNLTLVLIVSFFVISVIGSLLHFTHNWLKSGFWLHIFSALNESVWEHMKLLVLPTLLATVFQIIAFEGIYDNMNSATLLLLTVQLLVMPLVYGFLKLFFKKVPFMITILIFCLSIFLGLITEYFVLVNNLIIINETVAGVLVLIIVFLFGLFSFYTPRFSIFEDPITGKYGDIP